MKFISYSQNFEDVMLWRALKHVKNGFYIDVGAWDPEIFSISKAFYEHGWKGVSIEPDPKYAELLRKNRLSETVLEVAISDTEGELILNVIGDGLSTADDIVAKNSLKKPGRGSQVIKVPVLTLKTALKSLKEKNVHWMKIDVEGFEEKVLKGWNSKTLRPWVMVIEATVPESSEPSYQKWEPILLKADYVYVYSDRLNRFYVAKEHSELIDAFSYPPNIFDDFVAVGIVERDAKLYSLETELNSTKTELNSKINELSGIYHSRGWRLLVFLREILSFVIPKESLRRKVIAFLYNFSKKSVKNIFKIKGIILGFLIRVKNYFIKLKPRKKRKININSKKIVFIKHYYHDKTKSADFLIDQLKQSYEVKVILDESYIGKSFPDVSFIDNSYLGIIFWQSLPSKNIIQNIKNDNIIHFPMYDNSGSLDYGYWNNYRDIKIINFSKTLHKKLEKWGFDSMYIQYFPEPQEFFPGNNNEIFFWQRLDNFNINTITKLFKNNFKIHLHKAIDPHKKFIQPSKEIEEKFKITYSDWFETRNEMWDVIKQKGIYIAPREYEGIGLSFLEAMAMGKAVVAVDKPTMNEYIKDGENGYLFDLKHPKEIDLSNIEHVQKNTYEFMEKGYIEWENDKSKIIDFIKK